MRLLPDSAQDGPKLSSSISADLLDITVGLLLFHFLSRVPKSAVLEMAVLEDQIHKDVHKLRTFPCTVNPKAIRIAYCLSVITIV